MSDEIFKKFAREMEKHLAEQKVFIKNPSRIADVERATEIARKLFPESKIIIKDDPLQTGSLILYVENFDIVVRETKEFEQLISKADNFEIYPIKREMVAMSIMFNHALIRL